MLEKEEREIRCRKLTTGVKGDSSYGGLGGKERPWMSELNKSQRMLQNDEETEAKI